MTLKEYIQQLDNRIMLSLGLPPKLLDSSNLLHDKEESRKEARVFEERLKKLNIYLILLSKYTNFQNEELSK